MRVLIDKILDVILPRSDFEKILESISLEEFLEKSGGFIRSNFEEIEYFLSYKKSFVKKCVWSLKYKGNKDVARLFSHLLSDYLLFLSGEEASFGSEDKFLVTAVPISKEHLRGRGNNQCHLIMRELEREHSDSFHFNYKDLIKIKNTKSQTKTKSRKERRENVKNSFDVKDSHDFLDRKIILIDDVVTTGSTLHEARKVLMEAGANEVIMVAVVH